MNNAGARAFMQAMALSALTARGRAAYLVPVVPHECLAGQPLYMVDCRRYPDIARLVSPVRVWFSRVQNLGGIWGDNR